MSYMLLIVEPLGQRAERGVPAGEQVYQRMLEDLQAWETKPLKGAPQLLVVSTGTVEDNRALSLRAPVILDQGFSAGRQFGATGTPMAVLIDAQGRIASDVVAGGPAVLTLANAPHQIKLLTA